MRDRRRSRDGGCQWTPEDPIRVTERRGQTAKYPILQRWKLCEEDGRRWETMQSDSSGYETSLSEFSHSSFTAAATSASRQTGRDAVSRYRKLFSRPIA